jgi:hypothetical protein
MGNLRAGSHETHIPQKNIDQLGQLIQFVFSQFFPDPGDPGVVIGGRRTPHPVGVDYHGAEFEDAKRLTMEADAQAAIKNGSPILHPDSHCQTQKEGTQQEQPDRRKKDIQRAFHDE